MPWDKMIIREFENAVNFRNVYSCWWGVYTCRRIVG